MSIFTATWNLAGVVMSLWCGHGLGDVSGSTAVLVETWPVSGRHERAVVCSYTFFEQCQHRMASARCVFYAPKDSTKAQLIEAKDNLRRMAAAIPLTDDERAAVDDGQEALDRLLNRLADTPTLRHSDARRPDTTRARRTDHCTPPATSSPPGNAAQARNADIEVRTGSGRVPQSLS
ncbi:hypothetical protein [Streptomyces sp. NPDC092295]|uniref:hypothetical protein n=1 Tax=Streptomyces sp. NPDC092295 TaxID=3366011 RepID=UPI00381B4E47